MALLWLSWSARRKSNKANAKEARSGLDGAPADCLSDLQSLTEIVTRVIYGVLRSARIHPYFLTEYCIIYVWSEVGRERRSTLHGLLRITFYRGLPVIDTSPATFKHPVDLRFWMLRRTTLRTHGAQQH